MSGRIIGVSGPTVSVDTTGLKLYERVFVGHAHLMGEVVRLERGRAIVQVYESTRGLGAGEPVTPTLSELTVRLGTGLLGQMFDGLQRPLARLREHHGAFIPIGAAPLDPLRGADGHDWPVRVPRPYRRKLPSVEPLVTGQRVIDFLFPLAKGGTAIFPGGFGTGKTLLEQSIAKFADVDVVVYVGCGERGNEMAEMIEEFSALEDGTHTRALMDRTVIIANTSNMPVAAREASIYTAVTMAEYFRDNGLHVLLLADSLSRWAEALREISSALEEMPGEEGYPTYLASRMAEFFARAGVVETLDGRTGSLTLLLSVSPAGGDFTEPVTQACLRTAGALLMLDTALAHRRHFPAIDWFRSFSLYESGVEQHFNRTVAPEWSARRQQVRALLQQEARLREVAEIVGTEGLQDTDRRIMATAERIRRNFLMQSAYSDDAYSPPAETYRRIAAILDQHGEK
ncbi:MAG TPA: V-type ATP synthase subunit A [Vicinamibacterales bacterium]|jgi:V/A-type H+-transporting ATPase subunit A